MLRFRCADPVPSALIFKNEETNICSDQKVIPIMKYRIATHAYQSEDQIREGEIKLYFLEAWDLGVTQGNLHTIHISISRDRF